MSWLLFREFQEEELEVQSRPVTTHFPLFPTPWQSMVNVWTFKFQLNQSLTEHAQIYTFAWLCSIHVGFRAVNNKRLTRTLAEAKISRSHLYSSSTDYYLFISLLLLLGVFDVSPDCDRRHAVVHPPIDSNDTNRKSFETGHVERARLRDAYPLLGAKTCYRSYRRIHQPYMPGKRIMSALRCLRPQSSMPSQVVPAICTLLFFWNIFLLTNSLLDWPASIFNWQPL